LSLSFFPTTRSLRETVQHINGRTFCDIVEMDYLLQRPLMIIRSAVMYEIIALAVCCRLPTAAPQIRAQVRSCGIYARQNGTGAGFLRVFRFPLTILVLPTASHSSSIIRDCYSGPNSGRRTKWPQSHPTPRN
jgi:hypothetical protein